MRIALATFVGFAVATVIYASTGFQSPGTSPTWPPPGKAVVNIHGRNLPDTGLDAGEELVIYSVPFDRFLIITEYRSDTNLTFFQLCERLGGTDTVRMEAHQGLGGAIGPLGLVFQPGSDVVIKNADPTPPSHANIQALLLIGYLTR